MMISGYVNRGLLGELYERKNNFLSICPSSQLISLRHKTDKQESLLAIVFHLSMRDSQVMSNLQEVVLEFQFMQYSPQKKKKKLAFFLQKQQDEGKGPVSRHGRLEG